MEVVAFVLVVVAIYLVAGLLFAIAFVLKGVDAIDEGAHGTGWGFRLIIVPGCMVFWPLLLRKWMRAVKTIKQ